MRRSILALAVRYAASCTSGVSGGGQLEPNRAAGRTASPQNKLFAGGDSGRRVTLCEMP